MFEIALYQPEIPPNTGNIIRLCANIGAPLHLIKPLGFEINDKRLRRAGLDYHAHTVLKIHDNFALFYQTLGLKRLICCETVGKTCYSDMNFQLNDVIMFGSETKGVPGHIMRLIPPEQIIFLPMQNDIRSLNLANTVAITAYEAWRQHRFLLAT